MIASMSAARRLVRSRLATFVVCAGGALLAMPAAGLAAGWSPSEAVPDSAGAASVASAFDGGSYLTVVWNDGTGVRSSVRTTDWPAIASDIDTVSGSTGPDVAMSGSTSVAAWIGDDGNVHASTRTGFGAWSASAPVSTSALATSVQVAVVNDVPTIFWLDGGVVTAATLSGGFWTTPAAPAGAPTGVVSGLRVAVDSTGSGAAAWISGANVQSALISSGSWTPSALPLSATADVTTTLAVASRSSNSAIAWSESTAGVQVAVSAAGAAFTPEAGATVAAASRPALGFTSTGQLVVALVAGGSIQTEIRTAGGTWGGPSSRGSAGAAAPSVRGAPAGDASVTWASSSGVQMAAYDATAPTVAINAPADLTPGTHTWTATTSDVWSDTTTSWSFSDGGGGTGNSVQHAELVPGPVTATVTVTDSAGNSATASQTVTISSVTPTNDEPPAISVGTSVIQGGQLALQAGSWSGNPEPSVTEQWQRCAATCTNITGATGPTYTMVLADVGSRIRVHETGSNTGGSASADSAKTAVVGPIATGQPDLTPGATPIADGVTLTASSPASDWGGATGLTLVYRFQRCDGSCTIVQDSSSDTYTLGPADVGATFVVSAGAKAGPVDGLYSIQATSTSASTLPVAPKATSAPTLTGTMKDTQVLTGHSPDSSWNGATGIERVYVFQRCDASGLNCTVAQTGSSTTYTLKGVDLGKTILLVVQASSNSSALVSSSPSAKTAVIAPWAVTVSPGAPTGVTQDGETLTAPSVTWADPGALTFSYQWQACSTATGCSPISGATGTTYVLQPTDVGMTIDVILTASAGTASTSVTSAETAPVQPQNTAAASVT
jgi:hypothetical protein